MQKPWCTCDTPLRAARRFVAVICRSSYIAVGLHNIGFVLASEICRNRTLAFRNIAGCVGSGVLSACVTNDLICTDLSKVL